jgi:hypothetical protein
MHEQLSGPPGGFLSDLYFSVMTRIHAYFEMPGRYAIPSELSAARQSRKWMSSIASEPKYESERTRCRDEVLSSKLSYRPFRPIPLSSGCRLSSASYQAHSLFRLHNDAASEFSRDQNPRRFLHQKIFNDQSRISQLLSKCILTHMYSHF